MGYDEKGFSIISSIIDFNLFSNDFENNNTKREKYGQYWEDKTKFKLCETENSNFSN